MIQSVRSTVAMVAIGLALVAACAESDAPSPAVTAGPAEASDREGRFQLVLSLPSMTFPASEPITGEAVLTTLDGSGAGIAGSGGGVIAFSFSEIGGSRSMGFAMTSDCSPHTVPAGGGLRSSLRPSGAWSDDDPNADFYRAFAQGSDVRLPAGAWRITAHAVFMGAGCVQPEHTLEASTVVVVTP